jgi:hypothetical protein
VSIVEALAQVGICSEEIEIFRSDVNHQLLSMRRCRLASDMKVRLDCSEVAIEYGAKWRFRHADAVIMEAMAQNAILK